METTTTTTTVYELTVIERDGTTTVYTVPDALALALDVSLVYPALEAWRDRQRGLTPPQTVPTA